jgi:glycosyltransferase involved in cell wall biosynthesis
MRALQQVRSAVPDIVQAYASAEFGDRVKGALESRRYFAVQAEGIEMAQYLGLVPAARRVYDAHNAEFLLQRRASETAPSRVGRVYSQLQWRRLERFERHVVRTSRLNLAVSEHDANQLIALAGDANVKVIPSTIDVDTYSFKVPTAEDLPNLLFLGKLDYRPNAEALQWFVERVMPRLLEARLFVVGGNPPGWLVRAGQRDARIAVTGYVADERPYLARCSILVLPVRAGGGSRLKALVAMASGLPIVSTSLGMEGLEVEPDTHYLRADSDDEWQSSICRLLADATLRQTMAERARRRVEDGYHWSAMRARLEAAYAELDA